MLEVASFISWSQRRRRRRRKPRPLPFFQQKPTQLGLQHKIHLSLFMSTAGVSVEGEEDSLCIIEDVLDDKYRISKAGIQKKQLAGIFAVQSFHELPSATKVVTAQQ